MRNHLLSFLFSILVCGVAFSQTSAFQSADGLTSVYLLNAPANLVFNVSTTTFNLGYVREQSHGDQCNKSNSALKEAFRIKDGGVEYGVNFTGKPLSDLQTQLFQSGNAPAAVGGGGSFGRHGLFSYGEKSTCSHLVDDWAIVQVSYSRSTFHILPVANSATAQNQTFDGLSIMPTYNAQYDLGGKAELIAGVSAGVNRTNNLSSLTAVTVTTPSYTDPAGNSVGTQTSAYVGSYKTHIGAPIYSDFIFRPEYQKLDWLQADAFMRSDVSHASRFAEGGIGIFVAAPNKPETTLGGISVGWKDGKRSIGFIGGWTF